MENYNFLPEYISHMKEALKEEFYVEKIEEILIPDNTELLNFLKE
jgi:hypothetical protein